jgi:hypothetical protein
MSCSGKNTYYPMKKENPNQYVLEDQSKAPLVLSCPMLDYRLTNYVGEKVWLTKVPNKLFNMADKDNWHPTTENFETT